MRFALALSLSFCLLTPTLPVLANSQASQNLSNGSSLLSYGSLLVGTGASQLLAEAASAGITFSVASLEASGTGVKLVLQATSQASSEVSLLLTQAGADLLRLSAGSLITLTAITAEGASQVLGYTLSQSGQVLLYSAEASHQLHLYSERLGN